MGRQAVGEGPQKDPPWAQDPSHQTLQGRSTEAGVGKSLPRGLLSSEGPRVGLTTPGTLPQGGQLGQSRARHQRIACLRAQALAASLSGEGPHQKPGSLHLRKSQSMAQTDVWVISFKVTCVNWQKLQMKSIFQMD